MAVGSASPPAPLSRQKLTALRTQLKRIEAELVDVVAKLRELDHRDLGGLLDAHLAERRELGSLVDGLYRRRDEIRSAIAAGTEAKGRQDDEDEHR